MHNIQHLRVIQVSCLHPEAFHIHHVKPFPSVSPTGKPKEGLQYLHKLKTKYFNLIRSLSSVCFLVVCSLPVFILMHKDDYSLNSSAMNSQHQGFFSQLYHDDENTLSNPVRGNVINCVPFLKHHH